MSVFHMLFIFILLYILGTIVYQLIKSFIIWNQNNHSPIENRSAKILSKRFSVDDSNHFDETANHVYRSTTYYVTVAFDNGERQEFCVKGKVYGLLIEGDKGILTYQGSRWLNFVLQ